MPARKARRMQAVARVHLTFIRNSGVFHLRAAASFSFLGYLIGYRKPAMEHVNEPDRELSSHQAHRHQVGFHHPPRAAR
jgi:hypothetical protein